MADDALNATGSHHLYVHVPFCRLVCAYCDFVTVGGRAGDMPRYVRAVLRELELRPMPAHPATIYFGGGTPSLLRPHDVAEIVELATRRWGERPVEITLEANPSAREAPDWAGLRAAGVDRISLGAQSLDDGVLRALARGHSAAEVRAAYAGVGSAGFENISLDLIYGVPGQSLPTWRRSLEAAVALEPAHLSLYALQLALAPDEWAAPPRRGALRWRARLADRQDDMLAAEQYALAEEVLDHAGYRHYELSSWARPGRESRHNSAYWARRPYTGIGAGAHSYDGAGRRSWNVRELDRYLAAVETGTLPEEGHEALDGATREFEAVALGLRRVDGLSLREHAAEFGRDLLPGRAVVADVMERRLLEVAGDRLRLTRAGRLLANEVLLAFLPAPPQPARDRRTRASAPA